MQDHPLNGGTAASRLRLPAFIVGAFLLAAATIPPLEARAEEDPAKVVQAYAEIARAGYEDSLESAKALDAAVSALIATPSTETLAAARAAWIAARKPYQQTEAFRSAIRSWTTGRAASIHGRWTRG